MERLSWLGIGLVLAGAAMLLEQLEIMQVGWQPVLWALVAAFAMMKSIENFVKRKSGRVFWGTLLFLFGTYNVLRELDVIVLRSYWLTPALVLAVGFSLVMMYLVRPRDWHLLVPAAVFLGMGGAVILAELGYVHRYDVIEAIRLYWPVSLVAFGFALVLRKVTPPYPAQTQTRQP